MASAVLLEVEKEGQDLSAWQSISDDILLKLLCYLPVPTLVKVARVCKAWYRVAFDEILWKDLFYCRWKIARSIPMAPGKLSWVQEYKRLYYHTPTVESQVLQSHTDEVLHISFSHNGNMFASSSRDRFIKVWVNSNPCSIKHQADMRRYKWIYTIFSQFNEDDTLLLVSGGLDENSRYNGEIVIFNLQGNFDMISQVTNTRFGVYGSWFNDCCYLSGNFHWTGPETSCSTILLNKVCRTTETPNESMFIDLFHFRNKNYDFVKCIMIADVMKDETCSLHKASNWTKQATESSTVQDKGAISTCVHSITAGLEQILSDKDSKHSLKGRFFSRPAVEKPYSSDSQTLDLDLYMHNFESDFVSQTDANDNLSNISPIDLESLISENGREEYSHSFRFKVTRDLKSTASEMRDKLVFTSISDDDLIKTSSDVPTGHLDLIHESRTACSQPWFNDMQVKSMALSATNQTSGKENNRTMYQRGACQCHATATAVDNKAHVLSFPSDSNIQGNAAYSVNPTDLASSAEILSEVSANDETLNNGNGPDAYITSKLVDQVTDNDIHKNGRFEKKVNTSGPSVNKNKADSSCILESTDYLNVTDKYLIFKRGSGSQIPHYVEIKLIRAQKYFNDITKQLITDDPDNQQSAGRDDCDVIDYSFNMHGHIIGMCLSPDHRFLYVNSRPWLKDDQTEYPMGLHPLAKEIDIHIIDLVNLKELGQMQTSQKALVPENREIEIDLDVSQEYVASGAEDKHGYLWDRHYGICVKKFPHSDIVNSAVFNPADPEMLVTASDDHSIKVWRSLNREKELKKTEDLAAREVEDTAAGKKW